MRRMSAAARLASLLLVPLWIGCTDSGDDGAAAQADAMPEGDASADAAATPEDVITDVREITFAPELEVDLDAMEERESGLFVQVLAEGSGPPAGYGDEMGVHYTVWLPNGTVVDSSLDGDPLAMILGSTPLIDGWVEGVTGMRHHERRKLVLPYNLAYGEDGRSSIPPYSPLVYEVELAEHIPTGES